MSKCDSINGKPIKNQPIIINGKGKIIFGNKVCFGVTKSIGFHSQYSYIEARNNSSSIVFGDDIQINNNCNFIAGNSSINIGSRCRIGINCCIMDSDFHNIDPVKRNDSNYVSKPVKIGENVLIGNSVSILKGVALGNNCVVGTGAIVTKSFPENSIIAGNPARLIGKV